MLAFLTNLQAPQPVVQLADPSWRRRARLIGFIRTAIVTIEMRNVISFVQIREGDEDSGAVILSRREYSTAIDSGEGL